MGRARRAGGVEISARLTVRPTRRLTASYWTLLEQAGLERDNGRVASSVEDRSRTRTGRPRYRPLLQRVVATNAVLLVASCLLTVLIISPRKFASFAADEALVLLAALALVTLINTVVVHRFVAPLQALTALARRVDLASPGQRISDVRPTSEAGELATTFNEMLARLEHERGESTRRVLAAHESERLRVAQELHDEVGQTLTALLLQLSRAQERLPADMRGELSEAQEAARVSLEDVRRIATDLRPETLKDLGLASALTALSDGFGRRAGLHVERQIQTPMPQLSREAELAVYRVAQEALTNVARHAGSDTAKLTVASDGDRLTLIVRDHGRGLPDGEAGDGSGVRGMRERAALIGAKLTIERAVEGAGTELRLELPLEATSCDA
jgi:two-component system sensor histidine kinase UhpB